MPNQVAHGGSLGFYHTMNILYSTQQTAGITTFCSTNNMEKDMESLVLYRARPTYLNQVKREELGAPGRRVGQSRISSPSLSL